MTFSLKKKLSIHELLNSVAALAIFLKKEESNLRCET